VTVNNVRNDHRRKYFWGALGVSVVLLLPTLIMTLDSDMDIFQSMAWDLHAYGKLPYLGSWDHNFPGIVYIHWLAITLFGNNDLGFRVLAAISHLIGCALVFKITERFSTPIAAALAAVLFALYHSGPPFWLAGQRDSFASLCILIGVYFLLRGSSNEPKASLSFWLGVLSSIAILIRPTYGVFLISFLVLLWVYSKKVRNLLICGLGSLVPILLFIAPYFISMNGLREVLLAVFYFNFDVHVKNAQPFPWLLFAKEPMLYLSVLGVLFSSGYNANIGGAKYSRLLLALMTISSLLSVIAMGKYYNHHFDAFVTILIITGSIGFVKLCDVVKAQRQTLALSLGFLALLVGVYWQRHLLGYFVAGLQQGAPSAIEYAYARYNPDPQNGWEVQQKVKQYLQKRVLPTQPIEVVSIIPSMRWRVERESVTRFTTLLPLTMHLKQGEQTNYQKEWQKEFLTSLILVQPPYIVLTAFPTEYNANVQDIPSNLPHKVPGLDDFLAMQYHLDTVLGGYHLYRRK